MAIAAPVAPPTEDAPDLAIYPSSRPDAASSSTPKRASGTIERETTPKAAASEILRISRPGRLPPTELSRFPDKRRKTHAFPGVVAFPINTAIAHPR